MSAIKASWIKEKISAEYLLGLSSSKNGILWVQPVIDTKIRSN